MAAGSASGGTLTLHADPSSQPGDYEVAVTAAVAPASENLAPVVSLTVPFTVAVGVVVWPQVDTTSGKSGRLDELMSTSFHRRTGSPISSICTRTRPPSRRSLHVTCSSR